MSGERGGASPGGGRGARGPAPGASGAEVPELPPGAAAERGRKLRSGSAAGAAGPRSLLTPRLLGLFSPLGPLPPAAPMRRKQKRLLQAVGLALAALVFLPNVGLWSLYRERQLEGGGAAGGDGAAAAGAAAGEAPVSGGAGGAERPRLCRGAPVLAAERGSGGSHGIRCGTGRVRGWARPLPARRAARSDSRPRKRMGQEREAGVGSVVPGKELVCVSCACGGGGDCEYFLGNSREGLLAFFRLSVVRE